MFYHWQNLKEGKRFGGLRHGRAWLGSLGVEWCLPTSHLSIGFERSDERVTLNVSCLLFAIYLSWSRYKACQRRECCLAIHDGSIWISLWANPHEWNSKDPWWRTQNTIHVVDKILGRRKHSKETIETRDVLIPMPEGSYPATIEMVRAKWKRPRWFATVATCADVKIPKGIPFEGKGESSWDCGEDATYGMWTPANSVEEAIGKVVASSLKDRTRYGTPSRIQPVAAA